LVQAIADVTANGWSVANFTVGELWFPTRSVQFAQTAPVVAGHTYIIQHAGMAAAQEYCTRVRVGGGLLITHSTRDDGRLFGQPWSRSDELDLYHDGGVGEQQGCVHRADCGQELERRRQQGRLSGIQRWCTERPNVRLVGSSLSDWI